MRMEGRTTGKLGPFQVPEGKTATCLKHHMKSLHSSPSETDRAYASPTGTLYVSESVVKGVLPQVLDEMLSTRAMLKKTAKHYKKHVKDLSPAILRQLEARQLALKCKCLQKSPCLDFMICSRFFAKRRRKCNIWLYFGYVLGTMRHAPFGRHDRTVWQANLEECH